MGTANQYSRNTEKSKVLKGLARRSRTDPEGLHPSGLNIEKLPKSPPGGFALDGVQYF
jgi:hypothetical protein